MSIKGHVVNLLSNLAAAGPWHSAFERMLVSLNPKWRQKLEIVLLVGYLSLAVWAILPIFNITTAAFFKGEVMWFAFLLTALVIPPAEARVASLVGSCVPSEPHELLPEHA